MIESRENTVTFKAFQGRLTWKAKLMPGIQVTDLSMLEKVICAHKSTAYKMYISKLYK